MGKYSDDFLHMIETWYSLPDKTDQKLDAIIHRQYAEILEKGKDWSLYNSLYFRPSSANACKRELYHQVKGDRRDERAVVPYQTRWQRIGTEIGGLLQRDLLHIEKHYRKRVGEAPAFTPARTPEGYPFWEEFVWGSVDIEYRGKQFRIIGEPDGVLVHKDGRRVGLEIKSKQTTPARTSAFSMKTPEESHIKQAIAYAVMHDLDRYLIVYMNAAKKSWNMTPEEYEKNPDLRVFELIITQEMKEEVLGTFVDVLEAADENNPPEVDLTKWTFNNFKETICESLSEQEVADLAATAKAVQRSKMPAFLKNSCRDAVDFIETYRTVYNIHDGD